jgi:hypothetical protein
MRRSLLAVGLTATLLAPTAGQPAGLDSLWAFLASLWSAVSLDEGCGADPDGLCSQTQQVETDAGCGADPSGRCSQTHLETDEGCGADPWGRCTPAR